MVHWVLHKVTIAVGALGGLTGVSAPGAQLERPMPPLASSLKSGATGPTGAPADKVAGLGQCRGLTVGVVGLATEG